ncbi:MAG TPA: hypothetical protein VFS43_47725 [Polyangiaceae bacterium]|nr:hypothetical protein [Polyangiaceae bacterium]
MKPKTFSLLVSTVVTLGTVGLALEGHASATSVADASAIAADPTPEEREKLRAVAGAIWTPELAAGWDMNADVADVLSQATESILTCSEAFSLVPKPAGFLPGLAYLVTNALSLVNYFQAVRGNQTYRPCVVTAAANYRSAIEMASMGI